MSLITKALSSSSKGDVATLKSLRSQVTLSECCDKFGASPVHYAARAGKIDALRWLVQTAGVSGSKPANNGATPAHDAAATGQLDSLQWLIQNGGCSATSRDSCGATPLHLAARFGHLGVVVWLVESEGCSVLDQAQNGVTAVHLAAAKGSINCLKWLTQQNPSSVNKRAENGTTPVYFAAQEGRLDCLQFLLTQVEGNSRLRASDGMAPVHAAAQMGQLECLAWLCENSGVSPNERDNDGATPAHFAAARGHVNVLRWLLSHGGSVETDDLGGTPLHDAAEHGQLEALKVLISTGVNSHIRDLDGLTPADLAEECGHSACAAYLRSIRPSSPEPQPKQAPDKTKPSPSGFPPQSDGIASMVQTTLHSMAVDAMRPHNNSSTAVAQKPAKKNFKAEDVDHNPSSNFTLGGENELQDIFTKRSVKAAVVAPQSLKQNEVAFDPFEEDPADVISKNFKAQDAHLMSSVRQFESAKLKAAPQQKKNLNPTRLGRVAVEPTPQDSKASVVQRLQPQSQPTPSPATPPPQDGGGGGSEEDGSDSDDEYAHIPLWQRALMKKKEAEQKTLAEEARKQEQQAKAKWASVPAWKRAVLEKRESQKLKEQAVDDVDQQKMAERQAHFDDLPQWKKKLILQNKVS